MPENLPPDLVVAAGVTAVAVAALVEAVVTVEVLVVGTMLLVPIPNVGVASIAAEVLQEGRRG